MKLKQGSFSPPLCLKYSGRSDRRDELCYHFSRDLPQMIDFPFRVPVCDSHIFVIFCSPLIRMCACQGPRNVSFSENFTYVLNE